MALRAQDKAELKPPPGSAASSAHLGRAERIVYPENPRYRRVRSLSVLMDQSIVLPNGYRIGLDPILGLVPGLGDAVTTLISFYLVYESALLGLPKRILLRMIGNIALESLAGSIPVLGDLFDAVWKSNMRNLRLLEQHYHPALPGRTSSQIGFWMAAMAAALLILMGASFYVVAKVLFAMIDWLVPF